jgi:hypothetical protein
LRIAFEFSAGEFRDLFQSERHVRFLNCGGACAKRLSRVSSGSSTIVRGAIFAAHSKPAARMTARGQASPGQINPARIEDSPPLRYRDPLPRGES